LVSYISLNLLSSIFDTTHSLGIFMQGFISGIFGIITAIIILYLLKSEELAELIKTFRSKFWRAKVVVESPEEL